VAPSKRNVSLLFGSAPYFARLISKKLFFNERFAHLTRRYAVTIATAANMSAERSLNNPFILAFLLRIFLRFPSCLLVHFGRSGLAIWILDSPRQRNKQPSLLEKSDVSYFLLAAFFLNGQTRSGGSFRLRPAKNNGQIGSDRVWPVKKNSTIISVVSSIIYTASTSLLVLYAYALSQCHQ